MDDPIAFAAKHDPDTIGHNQGNNDHIERGHWQFIPIEDVPKGAKTLDTVWAMKRKRDIKTRQITNYKARLNVHGEQQQHGINCFDTYAPVVTWALISAGSRGTHVLKLLKNVYGQKQAGRVWYNHLKDGLEKI
eukprot:10185446-Ditylum_brightwellii.AAC.1